MTFKLNENVDLKTLSTFKLGGTARYVAEVTSATELSACLDWVRQQKLAYFVLGGGSNTVFSDQGFNGVIVKIDIKNFTIIKEDETSATIQVGAGEIWDEVVARCVELKLAGIEALSLIPGLAGSAPVQNIGAYGQEISQCLEGVEAYDTKTRKIVTLTAAGCKFAYRDSIFKSSHKGRYIITALELKLLKRPPRKPTYQDLVKYFADHRITQPSLAQIRTAVITIRRHKLPNPDKIPNAGSYFKNPLITRQQFDQLIMAHPELNDTPPGWSQPPRWFVDDNMVKLSAARLIELAGFHKGQRHGRIKIDDKHTLVLENTGQAKSSELFELTEAITRQVKTKFDIVLKPEPVIVD